MGFSDKEQNPVFFLFFFVYTMYFHSVVNHACICLELTKKPFNKSRFEFSFSQCVFSFQVYQSMDFNNSMFPGILKDSS